MKIKIDNKQHFLIQETANGEMSVHRFHEGSTIGLILVPKSILKQLGEALIKLSKEEFTYTFNGRKNASGDYIVRCYFNGKRYPDGDYYTDDKQDAEVTKKALEHRAKEGK
jgi:uncharacterized protein (DUF2141 family)